ncbi:hypothetical protein PISMIDRAFT_672428 [Pisolithus microcarpus 441]|uniref:Uncharacterized protein n=1 Tax=Pisolithus microcarpus 441 TaxID=765257 RepID=A0A0C9YVJ1_9AGAM|nr:hypothetical protein BKA83DRAFT_672428 [Pisolithus microcarpus]KIK29040.1 hypothetical protein PISMIDRAFT_672428 [Pisolithus microcarpus 441]
MSLRRRSTTHDLATLRLHPDGSRVQHTSVSARPRTSKYTVVDARGNRFARDAGGASLVKKRRKVDVVTDEQEREVIRLSPEADDGDGTMLVRRRYRRAKSREEGKQDAGEGESREDGEEHKEVDREQLDTRTKRRISFLQDFSFLDPPEVVIGRSFESKGPSSTTGVSFSPPAPELLKSIHHFATCYYRERGQLSDRSSAFRMEKRKGRNIHMMAAGETNTSETDDEMWEDRDDDSGQGDDDDDENAGKDDNARATSSHDDPDVKDMYKAFDGSALMAIGILIQEQIAHLLTSSSKG